MPARGRRADAREGWIDVLELALRGSQAAGRARVEASEKERLRELVKLPVERQRLDQEHVGAEIAAQEPGLPERARTDEALEDVHQSHPGERRAEALGDARRPEVQPVVVAADHGAPLVDERRP